ncbi:MAG: hypothetical protein ABEJ06_06730 [Haloarculaceae archaeon]
MPGNPSDETSPASESRRLYEDGTTDGLPVIPPTEERVAEMLRGTDHDPAHVLGVLGNNENPLTVEALAANAVMAGCLPTYLPVLEAGARALADEESNSIQFSVSTGSWAYQWLVNGPVRETLGIHGGVGAFGPTVRANRTIARALGLAYRNTAEIHPGEKDMGVMGNPFKFGLLAGENEAASPFEPYHVAHGFDAAESTISLAGPNSWIQWSPHENDAEHVLRGMIENTPPSMVGGEQQGGDFAQTVLHVLSPESASALADAGLTRREVTEYVAANSYIPEERFQSGALWEGALEGYHGAVRSAQVPQVLGPEYVEVVVAGRGDAVNAVVGPSIGGPVREPIRLPDGFDALVEEYPVDGAPVGTA